MWRQESVWRSEHERFGRHLETSEIWGITRRRAPYTPDLFERYLPYAAGFGVATDWGKAFQKMETCPSRPGSKVEGQSG